MATPRSLPRPSVMAHLRLAAGAHDLAGTLEHLHRTYGPVVDVGFRFPLRAVYLFGPEANQHLLADNAANFTWHDAFRLLEVVDGPTALALSDGAEHRRRRRLVQPAFAIKRVDAHVDLIGAEVDRALAEWRPGRQLNALVELRAVVRRIVVRALVGQRLGHLADELGARLEPALRYVRRTPLTRVDVDLHWNGYGRAKAAARAVDDLILAEVARRRAEGVDALANPDTLSALLVAAEETEGSETPLDDRELCDQVRSLIAAGYDTTSSAAAWLVHALGSNPDALSALRRQVLDTIGERPPTVDDLRAMPLVDGVVRETLRLWPPGYISGRRAIEDFEVLGHRVPGGSMVVYSPYITQRLPEIWGDPERFRPERWAGGEPVPFSFVPFGGGARKCIGFALATLELQVLAVRLAQRVQWRLDRPTRRATGVANFAPADGVPITVVTGETAAQHS
ncbi:MAG: cytochrome P450 [Acidimicrobiia bacterium]|nr:cytochrome P450 [Acidimicrobiia bacterium]